MPQTESLHIRVPQQMREEIDRIAASLERSRNYIVTEAIEQYVPQIGGVVQEAVSDEFVDPPGVQRQVGLQRKSLREPSAPGSVRHQLHHVDDRHHDDEIRR